MRHLYIIGARGFGRETYGLYKECKSSLKDVECIGFLDDNKNALDGFTGYPPIISSVEDYIPSDNDVFICALGEPKWVKHYTEIIRKKGGQFISLVSPYANIGSGTTIGIGCHIPGWTSISCDAKIGNHASIGIFCDFGHDVTIGDYSHIGSHTFLGGGVQIGECVTAHPRVSVLPHKKIGDNAILGAGSVVIKSVAPDTSVFGVPAKKITY